MGVLMRILGVLSLLVLAWGASRVIASQPFEFMAFSGKNPDITKVARHHAPSDVIFPKQSIPTRFFHDKHLALDIECVQCHESATQSVRASDVNLPSGQACDLCHSVDANNPETADPASACKTCHLEFSGAYEGYNPHDEPERANIRPQKMTIPEPNLKFNHKIHIDRGIGCETCHAGLDKIAVAAPENAFPVMGTCLTCHDGKSAPDECTTCHLADPGSRMITDFPQGKLKPHGYYRNDAHDEDFIKNHSQVARVDEGYCLSCHKRQDCVDCHNGSVRPVKIHPANWLLTHPITARKNSLECSSCHREQSFCIDCHRTTGIVDLAQNLDTTVDFHPDGWVNLPGQPVTGNHHMFQAQRNIRACVACHQEETCLKCHSAKDPAVFGVSRARDPGINPHPVDFKNRCGAMFRLNERACLKCHETNDPNIRFCK
ncbi:MAG: cytochrome c3 family protein [Myxococcales bacterium]|nr:cytochrome c3 family protein [Myxococcales bacterium]